MKIVRYNMFNWYNTMSQYIKLDLQSLLDLL